MQKKEYLSALTIPCTIVVFHFSKAFCNLGARINFIPLYIYMKLILGETKPPTMRLLMADKTIKSYIKGLYDAIIGGDIHFFG